MRQTIARMSGVLLPVALAVASRAGAQPTYSLSIDGPSSFEGAPGASVDIGGAYDLNLAEAGNDSENGAQGWSISLSSDGVTITSITTEGTVAADVSEGGIRNTGFEVSETTTAFRAGDECAGDGAVSAVVLSFVMNITLAVNESSNIARIETAGTATVSAARETVDVATIAFAQGCQGSGQPVDNNVTWSGQTVSPDRGSLAISCGGCFSGRCDDDTAEAKGLQIVAEGVIVPDSEDGGTAMNPALIGLESAVGAPGSTTVHFAIRSRGLASGVQGWSVSVAGDARLAIVGATTDGTDAADVNGDPPGLRNTGFEVSELTIRSQPGSACDGLEGAVSAVVLSFVMNITLDADGDNRILSLDVESTDAVLVDGSVGGVVQWKDGCQGSGQPVNNVATVGGNTETFGFCQAVTVRFSPLDPGGFAIPCDANRDGKLDLADAVAVVNDLFRDGDSALSFDCVAAYDCSEDGIAEIGDALVIAVGLFGGGPLPPAALAGECTEFDPEACAEPACAL